MDFLKKKMNYHKGSECLLDLIFMDIEALDGYWILFLLDIEALGDNWILFLWT